MVLAPRRMLAVVVMFVELGVSNQPEVDGAVVVVGGGAVHGQLRNLHSSTVSH